MAALVIITHHWLPSFTRAAIARCGLVTASREPPRFTGRLTTEMKLITGDPASIATVTLMCRKTKVSNFGLDFVGEFTYFFRRVATRWQEATCF